VKEENIMKLFKKKVKEQPFPQHIINIEKIMYGDRHVKIISIEEFQQYENNPFEIDYCAISNNVIYISSKAKYKHVTVY